MSRLLALISAAGGLAFWTLFGVVSEASLSSLQNQCPGGSDCEDARFAFMLAITAACLGLLLSIPVIRIWVKRKNRPES